MAYQQRSFPGLLIGNPPPGAVAPTNPFANYVNGNYTLPAKGTIGPGGARFNSTLSQHFDARGNPIDAIGDPFDFNAYGSGLWAQGIDPNNPATPAGLWDLFRKDSATNTDFQEHALPEVAKHGWDPNTKQGLSDIYNNYLGYLAHRMGKPADNFLNSGIGQILNTALQVALGASGPWGPALAAAEGGLSNGINNGSIVDGLLGAAGGYGSGSLGGSLSTNGIAGTFNNAVDGVKNFFGAGTPPSAGTAASIAGSAGSAGSAFGPGSLASQFTAGAAPAAEAAGSSIPGIAGAVGSGAKSFFDSSNIGPIASIAAAALPLIAGSTPTAAGPDGGVAALAAQNDQAKATRDAGVTSVNNAFGNQDDYYNRLRSSVTDAQQQQLDKQYGIQQRNLKFELARRGQLGSSNEIDATGDQGQLYNEGRLRIAGIADDAVRNAKIGDQQAKQNALASIAGGADSTTATQNALAQSKLAGDQAGSAARGQDLGSLWGKLAYLYNQNQTAQNTNAQLSRFSNIAMAPAGPGAASSGGGTSVRIS